MAIDRKSNRQPAIPEPSQRPREQRIHLPAPWRSRGYLPHFDQPGLVQSITFRLGDSLPAGFLDECERKLKALPTKHRQTEKEKRIAAMLDRGAGQCFLSDAQVADLVENALLFFDGERYQLLCWCIMPNHVHAMVECGPEHPLDRIVHSWKSFTATRANRLLNRTGKFWQTEYHDRFIRDDDHYARAFRYIEGKSCAGWVGVEEGGLAVE